MVAGAFFAAFLGAAAEAHEFWVNADYKDGLLKADLGYGHEFPNPEAILEECTHIFEPLKLATPEGIKEMTQTGDKNFHYEVKVDLGKGDYLVLGNYKPSFWAKGPEGWKQGDKAKYKELTKADATYAEEAVIEIGRASCRERV